MNRVWLWRLIWFLGLAGGIYNGVYYHWSTEHWEVIEALVTIPLNALGVLFTEQLVN